jgi:5-(carboxyamino)imidazole ribonucleotide synthase
VVRSPADAPVVGMVGAGQLARMTHQAAIGLGLSLRVLADRSTDSAALVVADVVVADYRDLDDLLDFAAGCDVLTFDHEHVPAEHLRALVDKGVVVHPGPEALLYAQDKVAMRSRLAELGLPVPRWGRIDEPGDVADFAAETGWPVVVKAVTGGYDGRGVWLVEGLGAAERLMTAAGSTALYVEERVAVRRELAAVVARRPSGEVAAWPVVETVQRDGICAEVLAPAPGLAPGRAEEARRLAVTIADRLDVVGVLAVELFETADGLLVNELAMRPHNSGHWSIEGARTSQFEQHLRAVLDWPLGKTTRTAPAVAMANVLGGTDPGLAVRLPAVLGSDPGVRVHLYGKEVRPGRKVGHVTVLGDDPHDVRRRAQRAAEALRGPA